MKRILNILFPATGIVLLVFVSVLFMPGTLDKLAPQDGNISNWWLVVFGIAIMAVFLSVDLSNRVKVFAEYKHSNNPEEFWKNEFPIARMRVMRGYLTITLLAALGVLCLVFWVGGTEAVKAGVQAAWIWWAIKILSVIIGFGVFFMFNTVASLGQGERLILGSPETAPDANKRAAFWGRIFQIKPTSTDRDVDLNEDFDGISELDNPPPPWFMYLFYLTILFAVIYFARFLASPDTRLRQENEYIAEMKKAEAARAILLANAAEQVDESTATLITDKGQLAAMQEPFVKKCAVCHGQKGEGMIGPNLTDEYWINGADVKDVFKMIKYGNAKGMQAFDGALKPSEIQLMASYVLSLQGTNPPNPKEPQGVKVVPGAATPQAEPTDSASVKSRGGDYSELPALPGR
jgi:mono/diheme cytochrome c family protein